MVNCLISDRILEKSYLKLPTPKIFIILNYSIFGKLSGLPNSKTKSLMQSLFPKPKLT